MLTLAIPNRNGARFLSETLASLERNRPHVRWWFQDSCSSDDSVEIAKRFQGADDRIQVERDRGQTDGLNRAFASMGGEIIGFLNSDDCLTDGAAEAVLAAFAADPALDLVYGQVEWIDEQGRSQGFHRGDISSYAEVLDIYGVWWNGRQWVQPEVFWRRRLWSRVGGFDETFDLAFDYDYWVRCFQHGVKVKQLPRVLAQFRRHDAQKSTAAAKAASEIRRIVVAALDSQRPLPLWNRLRLRNRLSYDLYHCGQGEFAGMTFPRALAFHPNWLALPEVRSRLGNSRLAAALTGRTGVRLRG